MKKNKILLGFAIFLTITYALLLMFKTFREYWFGTISCFVGLYSLLYCIMYKLDSSLYYSTLVLGISATSFVQNYYNITASTFYPMYIMCFAMASFAVFVLFRQKIHFKLFAILFFECILLIAYKFNKISLLLLLTINTAYLLLVGINVLIRLRKNFKEN